VSQRRPRNVVSRNADLAARAAELLDDGLTDAEVAKALNVEFSRSAEQAIKAKAVFAFRHGDYERVSRERRDRRDAAAEVNLILGAARDAGADFAQAGQDLLAKMMYDALRSAASGSAMESKELVAMGKTLAKFQEVHIARLRAQADADRQRAAADLKSAVSDRKLSGADLVAEVDRIMGIKP
jgi:hypothetical protein